MRIYSPEIDRTVNQIEITLNKEQFEDFLSSIDDLSNNPLNKKTDLLYEIVDGDTKDGYEVQNELVITRYNIESIGEFFGERNKMIILFDK